MTQALPSDCAAALRAGDTDLALQLAIKLLHRNKEDLGALAACFRAYEQQQDSGNAAKVLEVMLRISPDNAWALTEAGLAQLRAERHDDAEQLLRRAISTGEAPAAAHAGLGLVLSELNHLAAGEQHFRKALALGDRSTTLLLQLGLNLARQERGGEAEAFYRRALTQAPDDLQSMAYLAKHLEVTGRLDAAAVLLDQADRQQPGATRLLRATLLTRQGQASEALRSLEQTQRLNGDGLLERGRLKDRLGDYAGAWKDLVAAKSKLAEEAGGLRYDRAAVGEFLGAMRRQFSAPLMAELPRAPIRRDEPQPLFIMGPPRSGTTLLERILSAHSRVHAGGELPFVGEWRVLLERLLPGDSFPECVSQLRAADVQYVITLMRDQYLALRGELGGVDKGAQFVTDKMPFNEIWLPLVRLAFPRSPIVLLSRDLRDTTVSMLANKLNHGFHCAYRVEDTVHYLEAVRDLVQHYAAAFSSDLRHLAYEDLVQAPEREIPRLLEDLGLAFEPACLAFQNDGAYVATPSYEQVNQPISSRAAGRYKNYAEQLAPFFPEV